VGKNREGSVSFDILIKNPTIVDGTGRAAFQDSVGIIGQKIAAIGDVKGDAARVIDGSGLVTCPGFVDPHTHADVNILQYPLAENFVMQGVTTCAGGNCGISLAPIRDIVYARKAIGELTHADLAPDWQTFGEWLSRVESSGASINMIPLVGHSTVRGAVTGQDFRRSATADEVEAMKQLVAEAMQSGAFGLSAGLDMPWSGYYADVDEVVALVKVTQEYGGLFVPHTRHLRNLWPTDEPSELLYTVFHGPKGEVFAGRYHGLLEAVEISKQANNARLHIAHFPLAYLIPQPHPDFLDDAVAKATLVEIVDNAANQGVDITYDVIAEAQGIAGETRLIDLFFGPLGPPAPWLAAVQKLGKQAFVDKLTTRAFRDEMKRVISSGTFKFGMVHPCTDPYWMDRYTVLCCRNQAYGGQTIGELARIRQPAAIARAVYEESIDVVLDILVEDPAATWAMTMDNRGNAGTQGIFLKHPAGMPCTDVIVFPSRLSDADTMGGYGVSPAAFGLFPGYFKTFVKERGVLSLEEAVKKATSVPAQEVFGLEDRGVIRQGAYADIVLFDLGRIGAANDFLEPSRPPQGLKHVLVNGTVVYENGLHTGKTPGKVLRRS